MISEMDINGLKFITIKDLEKFAENLKSEIERNKLIRGGNTKESEEWLRLVETEIFERSFGLKES